MGAMAEVFVLFVLRIFSANPVLFPAEENFLWRDAWKNEIHKEYWDGCLSRVGSGHFEDFALGCDQHTDPAVQDVAVGGAGL